METGTQVCGSRTLPVQSELILAHGKAQVGAYQASHTSKPVILKLHPETSSHLAYLVIKLPFSSHIIES